MFSFDTTTGATGTTEAQAFVQEGRSVTTQNLTTDTGMVYLDFPDLEITEATITREVDGERDILIKLNNDSDTDLAGSGRKVKISFYSDATCEKPFTELVPEAETASGGQSESAFGLAPIYVTDAEDLAMIDEGGYSVSTTFDAEAYLAAMPTDSCTPQPTEIPDGGIIVTLLDKDGNVLGQQQSYDGTGGLITLGAEARAQAVTFLYRCLAE